VYIIWSAVNESYLIFFIPQGFEKRGDDDSLVIFVGVVKLMV